MRIMLGLGGSWGCEDNDRHKRRLIYQTGRLHDAAIATETSRAITAEDSNAFAINDLIAELALDVVQVGDPRLSFTGTWTSQAGTWGANRFSSVSRYSSCEGDTDCSAHTITMMVM